MKYSRSASSKAVPSSFIKVWMTPKARMLPFVRAMDVGSSFSPTDILAGWISKGSRWASYPWRIEGSHLSQDTRGGHPSVGFGM